MKSWRDICGPFKGGGAPCLLGWHWEVVEMLDVGEELHPMGPSFTVEELLVMSEDVLMSVWINDLHHAGLITGGEKNKIRSVVVNWI